jgi:hypothetical protein
MQRCAGTVAKSFASPVMRAAHSNSATCFLPCTSRKLLEPAPSFQRRNAKQFRFESSVIGRRWFTLSPRRLPFHSRSTYTYSEGVTMTNNDNRAVRQ